MAKSKKRKKAVKKLKREAAGKKKFLNDVRAKGVEKVRELQRKIQEMHAHKKNTVSDDVDDIYSRVLNEEE